MARAHIGTSGWNYKHWWNGTFYSRELKPALWLQFFAQHFDTVEINNSFYRLPTEAAFESWRDQVPPNFVFAVKASRYLTHMKRLKDPEKPLELFFSRANLLRDRLGPILFQLPPRFKVNLGLLKAFLAALDAHGCGSGTRCAMEVRDATWLVQPVFDLLRRHRVALCFADWRDKHVTEPVTADFVYLRRHFGQAGDGNYSKQELDRDVAQMRRWLSENLDVYVYFNNDWKGYAVQNAKYVQSALFSANT